MEPKCTRVLLAVSLAVLVFAVIMASFGFPYIISGQIKRSISLDNGSMSFELWKKLPVPLTFKVYIFNVTNPQAIVDGEKPELTEIGPFIFDQYREKEVIGIGPDDTLSYRFKKTYYFNQKKSGNLTLDDKVTVLNVAFVKMLRTVQDAQPAMLPVMYRAAPHMFADFRDPFLRTRAGDLLFDGVLVDCSHKDNSTLVFMCKRINESLPHTMRLAESPNVGFYFSMFNHLNNTFDGPYVIKRGRDDIRDLGRFISYKGNTTMDMWGPGGCRMINGTDGAIYPPIDESNPADKLFIFQSEVCRSMYIELTEQTTVGGLRGYKYEATKNTFACKTLIPENKCFCTQDWSSAHDGCLLTGVFNLAPCQNAPIIASFPHFYLASEELLDYIESGLSPDAEKHSTFAILEPVTGVTLKGAKRIQFNMELRNMPSIPVAAEVMDGVFPILWIEESAGAPENVQEKLRTVYRTMTTVSVIKWLLVVASIVAVCVFAFMFVSQRKSRVRRNSVNFALNSHTAPLNANKN